MPVDARESSGYIGLDCTESDWIKRLILSTT